MPQHLHKIVLLKDKQRLLHGKKRDSKCPNDYSNFTNAEAPAPPADDDDDRRSHTKDQRHSKSTKNMQRINLQIPQTHVQIPNMDNY